MPKVDWDKVGQRPKLMVLGYARHGKDTACEILRDEYGYNFASSSLFVLEKAIMPVLATMGHTYDSVDEAMKRREEIDGWRAIWFKAIADYNTPDETRLGRELYEKHDIYCGIRRLEELKALQARKVFRWSIWIDSTLRLPPERSDSNTLHPGLADFVVSNNTSLADLRDRLCGLMAGLDSPLW